MSAKNQKTVQPPRNWSRVTIPRIAPEIDGGRYPIKRVAGDVVEVEVDLVVDGHEVLGGRLLHRERGAREWDESPLEPLVNDRWRGEFTLTGIGRHEYTVEAWIDEFASWRAGFRRKVDAEEDVTVDLLVGAQLLADRARHAKGSDARVLKRAAERLADEEVPSPERAALALDGTLDSALERHPDRSRATRYDRVLEIVVERQLARFGAWYEFFPRSFGPDDRHGTFADAEAVLPYVARMGFDIVYLPPIHPIGERFRKGPNNTLDARSEDPGSPWAIGSAAGGHKAVHPELGTLEDFDRFVAKAKEMRLEVALDIALQCAPDHPYVREHPEWFKRRPDGSIQYAENPPKKYQDICPFDFECEAWQSLWEELCSIFEFWCERGIRTFRVDNPHTKPILFWEWCIGRIKERWPDTIFLSEAFTRPKMMYGLAKVGFSQSYTYFTWRRFKDELADYAEEVAKSEVAEYFRPNFWPNTPDILPDDLKGAPRGGFVARLVLAATLTANYGIYGPAFELMENVGRPGSGEYIDNEKYELRRWDLDRPDSLRPLITRLNRIRKQHVGLQRNDTLCFHDTDNDQVICYSKSSPDGSEVVVVVVNLDYHHKHGSWIDLDTEVLGWGTGERFQVHDLIGDTRHQWRSGRNYVELDPHVMPAHVFLVRRFLRTEHDFDYFA